MTTHQNRSKKTKRPGDNPTPEMIRALRERSGMTQTAFGELGFYSLRGVQDWEAGLRRMHPLTWAAYRHMLGEQDLPQREPG